VAYDGFANWNLADDIRVYGWWKWNWLDESAPLQAINGQTLTLGRNPETPVTANQRIYAYNVLAELDVPGEYYIDRAAGEIYFYPPGPLEGAEILLSGLRREYPVVAVRGASHTILKNLTIPTSRGNGMRIDSGSDNVIFGCEVANVAGGIDIGGGERNGVVANYIHDTYQGALGAQGGDRQTLTPGGNYLSGNHVKDYAKLMKTYSSALGLGGVGQTAVHNRIENGPHQAFILSGNEQTFAYNDITQVLRETDDAGVFYHNADWTNRGNTIAYNYFHDIGPGYWQMVGLKGIYLDQQLSSLDIIGNIFCNMDAYGVTIGGGRDCVVRGNIFENTKNFRNIAVSVDDISDREENPVIWDRLYAVPFDEGIWAEKYPSLASILDEEPLEARGNVIQSNALIRSGEVVVEEKARQYGVVSDNVALDTGVSLADLSAPFLKEKLRDAVYDKIPGFEPIDIDRIGLLSEVAEKRAAGALLLSLHSGAVSPLDEDGTLLLPVRSIVERLGGEVAWDAETSEMTAVYRGREIKLKAGAARITLCGETKATDGAARLIDDTLYAGTDALEKALQKFVFYDAASGLVALSGKRALFDTEKDKWIIQYLELNMRGEF
jgi:hypothetical protein